MGNGFKLDRGGFVFSTEGGNVVGTGKDISTDTLKEIARLLGIPEADRDKLVTGTRSVYIYRDSKNAPSDGSDKK
jgi:hypothetical protein